MPVPLGINECPTFKLMAIPSRLSEAAISGQFVYVIGLHAVQFGNNWMRKILRTAKLDEAVGRVQFGSPRNFLNPIISKLDKHVVVLPNNYIVYYLRVKNNADFVRNMLF